jgi:hypothetical protein
MKKIIPSVLLYLFIITVTASCKKEKDPELPEVSFKSGMGYVSESTTVGKSNQLTIGVTARKNKAPLKTFIVYQAYDNFEYQQVYLYTLMSNEGESFSRDYQFTTRTEGGRERYKFTVTDAEGNTGFKEIILQVQ